MFQIKCSCGNPECSADMEITKQFDKEGNIEVLIYNRGLPNSIYMNKETVNKLREYLWLILLEHDTKAEELGFC